MLGTGFPSESYRPVIRVRSESANSLARHEFGDSDSAWLMTEAQQNRIKTATVKQSSWLVTLRAAASKIAALLF